MNHPALRHLHLAVEEEVSLPTAKSSSSSKLNRSNILPNASRYLNHDSIASDEMASIAKEHSVTCVESIQPVFDPVKAHGFNSFWNWVRQDALVTFYEIIFGCQTTVNLEITARRLSLLDRTDPELLTRIQYLINQLDPSKGETYYQFAMQFS